MNDTFYFSKTLAFEIGLEKAIILAYIESKTTIKNAFHFLPNIQIDLEFIKEEAITKHLKSLVKTEWLNCNSGMYQLSEKYHTFFE